MKEQDSWLTLPKSAPGKKCYWRIVQRILAIVFRKRERREKKNIDSHDENNQENRRTESQASVCFSVLLVCFKLHGSGRRVALALHFLRLRKFCLDSDSRLMRCGGQMRFLGFHWSQGSLHGLWNNQGGCAKKRHRNGRRVPGVCEVGRHARRGDPCGLCGCGCSDVPDQVPTSNKGNEKIFCKLTWPEPRRRLTCCVYQDWPMTSFSSALAVVGAYLVFVFVGRVSSNNPFLDMNGFHPVSHNPSTYGSGTSLQNSTSCSHVILFLWLPCSPTRVKHLSRISFWLWKVFRSFSWDSWSLLTAIPTLSDSYTISFR